MKRGVGWCIKEDCSEYLKMCFMLHTSTFHCPTCKMLGGSEMEWGEEKGKGEYYKEVRVEYNFRPDTRIYRALAIVRDEGCPGSWAYTLYSPLVKTEARALKMAEALLSNLRNRQGAPVGDEVPSTREDTISFDSDLDTFKKKLREVSSKWDT